MIDRSIEALLNSILKKSIQLQSFRLGSSVSSIQATPGHTPASKLNMLFDDSMRRLLVHLNDRGLTRRGDASNDSAELALTLPEVTGQLREDFAKLQEKLQEENLVPCHASSDRTRIRRIMELLSSLPQPPQPSIHPMLALRLGLDEAEYMRLYELSGKISRDPILRELALLQELVTLVN